MSDPLRDHLARLLDWKDAHAGFDAAVRDLPEDLRGRRPAGLPHSPWELLEHIRLAQRDILDFCVAPKYEERAWPDGYWPADPAPPTATAWEESVRACRADREEVKKLARDASIDLFAAVPNGTGQTYLREILLVADHNAYHLGQLVLVRRALGAWSS
ncbi:MAG TPA: DinB family protein [Thermoanaerobaculia bacterium]